MGWSLRPGVTCCCTGGFTFFLDVERDRYLAIGDDADALFGKLIQARELAEPERALARRLQDGAILIETAGDERPMPCTFASTATASAIDRAVALGLAPSPIGALARIALARAALRYRGLQRTLSRFAARKRRLQPADRPGRLAMVAAAFERCNAMISPLDQCLPRSIAVGHRLIDLGCSPTLIIAVKAAPFAAHAWVECDGVIANDRFDMIAPFTPILVL